MGGSQSNTSTAAPAIRPSFKACASALLSTIGPLAQLIKWLILHQCDLLRTDHSSGLLVVRRMQGNNITLSQQVIQRFVCNSCCLHFFSFVSGIGIDFRTECLEKLRCHETDLTAADDSHLLLRISLPHSPALVPPFLTA